MAMCYRGRVGWYSYYYPNMGEQLKVNPLNLPLGLIRSNGELSIPKVKKSHFSRGPVRWR